MYICLCHGVTEEQVERCIAEGARSLNELKCCLGIAASCGKCAPVAKDMLDQRVAAKAELKVA
jgi:bacterioferritin-associated ferredoxin